MENNSTKVAPATNPALTGATMLLFSGQPEACNKLVKYATDEDDRSAVEREINELKMTLDLTT